MALKSITAVISSIPKTEIQLLADYSALLILPILPAVAYHYSKK